MTIEEIKRKILELLEKLDAGGNNPDNSTGAYFDDIKDLEMYESDIVALISGYCEGRNYEVDGFPFQKRKLKETNEDYDEDYFCYERYLKYIAILATIHADVQDLMWFYQSNIDPDTYETKEEFVDDLKNNLKHGIGYDVEF